MQVVRKLTRESLQNDCIVSVGTELDIWLYRTHVRSYNLAANAGIAVSFVSNVNLFLTFPWSKVRNRKTRQYVTAETLTRHLQSRTGRATRILLFINALALFRVAKYTTLKSTKWLLFSDLQVTQKKCRRLEPNLTSVCS